MSGPHLDGNVPGNPACRFRVVPPGRRLAILAPGTYTHLNSEFCEMTMDSLEPLVDLLKTLGHPARLRILALLREGELCVCQINAVLGVATSTVSEHLTELRRAGLLAERKDGRWVHYALRPRPGLEGVLQALWPHLEAAPQVAADREQARQVRQTPLLAVCAQEKTKRVRPQAGNPAAQ